MRPRINEMDRLIAKTFVCDDSLRCFFGFEKQSLDSRFFD